MEGTAREVMSTVNDLDTLREAAARASEEWPATQGDTNLLDVYVHATRTVGALSLRLPTLLPRRTSACASSNCERLRRAGGIADWLPRESPWEP
jgi:hypothetical protein